MRFGREFLLAAAVMAAGDRRCIDGRVDLPTGDRLAGVRAVVPVFESGVHATIAGVVMGLLTPARPLQTDLEAEQFVDVLENRSDLARRRCPPSASRIRNSVSPCDRLIDALHPWTSYLIVPLFALANAGIVRRPDALANPSRVLAGVAVALVVGKLIGVVGFAGWPCDSASVDFPHGATWGHLIGVGALAGIGFTVSLFITGLAFDAEVLQADAKIGIFVASIAAAALGAAIILLTSRRQPMNGGPSDEGHRSQSPALVASPLGGRAVPPLPAARRPVTNFSHTACKAHVERRFRCSGFAVLSSLAAVSILVDRLRCSTSLPAAAADLRARVGKRDHHLARSFGGPASRAVSII